MTRAVARAALWVAAMCVAGELAVRAAALVLRRDAAPPATGKVVYCVGDSFTYGQGVRPDEAWPQVLRAMLRDALGDRAPEVRTLAETGRSSSVAVVDVATALERGDARMILVMTGWNANDGDFAAHREAVPWTTRLDLALSHSRLYRVAKQAATFRGRTIVAGDVRIVPQTTAMSLYGFHAYQEIGLENLTTIARLCRTAGVPCAFLTYPHQLLPANASARTEYYHSLFGRTPLTETDYLLHDRRPGEIAIDAVIRHAGETEGVPVIDLQPAFDAPSDGPLYQRDWHHPTAAGHARIARVVFDVIRPTLASSR